MNGWDCAYLLQRASSSQSPEISSPLMGLNWSLNVLCSSMQNETKPLFSYSFAPNYKDWSKLVDFSRGNEISKNVELSKKKIDWDLPAAPNFIALFSSRFHKQQQQHSLFLVQVSNSQNAYPTICTALGPKHPNSNSRVWHANSLGSPWAIRLLVSMRASYTNQEDLIIWTWTSSDRFS